MLLRYGFWISSILWLGGCGSAPPLGGALPAGTVTLAGAPPYAFDCDAPPGKYRNATVALSAKEVRVKGFVQFLSWQGDSTFGPWATIVFAGPAQHSGVGLQAFVLPNAPDSIQFAVESGLAQEGYARAVFATTPLSATLTPFELSVAGPGNVNVGIGSVTKTVSVAPLELTRVNLSCSTAHVRFSGVTVTALP
ncbi:MAG TPA: hypothetical protein VEH54_05080 [Steroidobacteraceae bacterium]|nr:hypothetical protein [Steroidobacteraceae bacterium]